MKIAESNMTPDPFVYSEHESPLIPSMSEFVIEEYSWSRMNWKERVAASRYVTFPVAFANRPERLAESLLMPINDTQLMLTLGKP
jgi:hypothetical protein